MSRLLQQMLAYKQWANSVTYADVAKLPPEATEQKGPTKWGSITYTLSHIWTVDDIFRHHVLNKPHHYTQRNLDAPLPVAELHNRQEEMDRWWIDHINAAQPEALEKTVEFTFVGGGAGSMRVDEIVVHLVNHATYHRGLVSSMLYDHGVSPTANDYPVYIRDSFDNVAG